MCSAVNGGSERHGKKGILDKVYDGIDDVLADIPQGSSGGVIGDFFTAGTPVDYWDERRSDQGELVDRFTQE